VGANHVSGPFLHALREFEDFFVKYEKYYRSSEFRVQAALLGSAHAHAHPHLPPPPAAMPSILELGGWGGLCIVDVGCMVVC
jgi:hypothetical protein